MMQRDFILRMIEEMGRFLSRLARLRDKELYHKGFQEFDTYMQAHFQQSVDDLLVQGVKTSLDRLNGPLSTYPDELGQLLFSGGTLAIEDNQRAKGQVLYQLAWEAYRMAELNGNTYRFDRMVEMNAVRDQLAAMGVAVEGG